VTAVVKPAEPDHVQEIAALLAEMDAFYGATDQDPLESRITQINEALFSAQPAAHALLAWENGQLAGIASYSFLWPAVGLTKSLYLKELYVCDQQRRTGTGQALMHGLHEVAARQGCSRIEWTTDTGNVGAQDFYKALGVEPNTAKLFYRVEGDAL
jgi:GNAT superfamily N-acetyltransferase